MSDVKSKPGVIVLHARSNVVSKLITVVEIAKREVEQENGKWFQYSRVWGELCEFKEKQKQKVDKDGEGEVQAEGRRLGANAEEGEKKKEDVDVDMTNEGEEEEEEAFETMAPKAETARKKVRAVPILTIYVSRVPVPELKAKFGYVSTKITIYFFFY